ncbi:hypothetical protein M426DRAFT_324567 [Hypoxylon sp. CI-4A]|nr:hypothetical protein M426DRAFT_324567 [Hypoxylon sp. CI-4A]
MATPRLAIRATALGGVSSRAIAPRAATWICPPRAPFGTTSSQGARTSLATAGATARPRAPSRTTVPVSTIRWSSSDSTPSRLWTFEEINQTLTAPTSTSTSTTTPKVTLIDVREPSELARTGRIPGALNVPISSAPDSFHIGADEFEERYGFARPDPEDGGGGGGNVVVFYCKAGVRSRAAAQIARSAGWRAEAVGEYPGSWLDWVEKGGKIER